jgi:predicted nucleic acid-binding protein
MKICSANEMNGMTEPLVNLVYLDTNVFIKAVEGTDEAGTPAKAFIDGLRNRRTGIAVTSELTLAEVLATSKRPDAAPLHIKRPAYLDLLVWSGLFTLIPVSRNILLQTAELRAKANFKLPDAIHLVSAVQARCSFFVSADKDFERMPKGMELVSSDHESLSRLIRELS